MLASDRISRLSTVLFLTSSALIGLFPVVFIYGLYLGWTDPAWLSGMFAGVPVDQGYTPLKSMLVVLAGALALPPMLMAFWHMRSLFDRYRAAEILTDACARHILRVGQALVAVAIVGVLVPTLQILILTAGNAEGTRQLSIGIDGSTVGFLLAGGLLVVIGWVMREAAVIAEDAKGFV